MQKILPALVVIFECGLHVLVVHGLIDGKEHGGRTGQLSGGGQFIQCVAKLRPGRSGFGRNREIQHQGGKGFRRGFLPAFRAGGPAYPEFLGHSRADAGQQHHHAAEGKFILGIDHKTHKCHHVLNMGLLEKPDAAGDAERYFSAGQFHLQFHAVEVGAVKHGYFTGVRAFFNEIPDTLDDKFGLYPVVVERDKGGGHFPGGPHGAELFFNLNFVGGDSRVGKLQNFRHTAVIGFYLESLCRRIAGSKAENIFHVRSAPGVDALGIVPHHHQLAVFPGQHVNEAALEVIGVLVLIHQNMLEAGTVQGTQVLLFLKKPHDVEKQVVKVHAVGFLLAGYVLVMHLQDGVQVVGKVGIGVFQRFPDIGSLVVCQTEQG